MSGMSGQAAEENPAATPAPPKGATYFGKTAAIGHIILLTLLIPFTLTFVLFKKLQKMLLSKSDDKLSAALICEESDKQSEKGLDGKAPCIMIVGAHYGKTLSMMRALKTANPRCKIVLTDEPKYAMCGARFSKYCDAFEVVNAKPSNTRSYTAELLKVAEKHEVTGFMPVSQPEASRADAAAMEHMRHKINEFDRPYHVSPQVCDMLDDKFRFCKLCSETLKLPAPRVELLDSDEKAIKLNEELLQKLGTKDEVRPMIIKNLSYDCLHRLDLFTLPAQREVLQKYVDKIRADGNPITAAQPWVAQTKLMGVEYSAAIIIRKGEVALLAVTPSSASQLDFQHIEHPMIIDWVHSFVAQMRANSQPLNDCQLCFDFMEVPTKDAKGKEVFPIECNTRIHSQLSIFATTELGRTYLGAALLGLQAGTNKPSSMKTANLARPTFHFGNELFKFLFTTVSGAKNPYGMSSLDQFAGKALALDTCYEADLDAVDWVPFFMKLHLQLPYLLMQNIKAGNPWKKLDFCIGKVVELHGE